MTFTKVGSEIDFLYDRMIGVQVSGKEVLVTKLKDRYYALGNICTHNGCRLSGGKIRDGKIRCPCHGSVFDPATGKVLQGPATKPIPVYHIKIENGAVWVNL
ncbi:MAG: Rieske (2Fe-2S) protein [Methanomicrobiales archaeon]|nr:Rieske (2Fe-2S) protein [Methanomicrobiales archaeon]